jgi:hypothetical protein
MRNKMKKTKEIRAKFTDPFSGRMPLLSGFLDPVFMSFIRLVMSSVVL